MRIPLAIALAVAIIPMATQAHAERGPEREVIIKKVYRQPLTNSRVNTMSTRAVDARRAAAAGTIVRQSNTAYTVQNPMHDSAASTAYTPRAERASGRRPIVIAQFVNGPASTTGDDIGVVRAQPPIARAQDALEAADHRAFAAPAGTPYVVTSTDPRVLRKERAERAADAAEAGASSATIRIIVQPTVDRERLAPRPGQVDYLLYPDGTMYPAWQPSYLPITE